MKNLILIVVTVFTAFACTEPEQKAYNKIAGVWEVQSIAISSNNGNDDMELAVESLKMDFSQCEYGQGGCYVRFDFGNNQVFTLSYGIDHDNEGDKLLFTSESNGVNTPTSDQEAVMTALRSGICLVSISDNAVTGTMTNDQRFTIDDKDYDVVKIDLKR